MATEDQLAVAQRGGGRQLNSQLATLVVSGDGTVKAQLTLPRGGHIDGVRIETPTAISGAPTHANVNIGLTDGGAEVVAAVDAQAQGHITGTLVAALDAINTAALATVTLYAQVVTTGGTAPAGTIYVRLGYFPPNP